MHDRLYHGMPRNLRKGHRSGLTLIDMSCTILLVGIMASIAIPRLSSSINYYSIESATKQIAAEIEMVRRYARTTGTNQSVTFDTALNKITMSGLPDLNHPGSNRVIQLNNMEGVVTLVSANFAGLQSLTFDMHGKPANGGTILLRSGSLTKTISVNGTSGRISIP